MRHFSIRLKYSGHRGSIRGIKVRIFDEIILTSMYLIGLDVQV